MLMRMICVTMINDHQTY